MSDAVPEPLMTTEQVATWLAVSTFTVREYVKKEKLPCVILHRGGRPVLRFKRDAIQRWIDERSGRIEAEPEDQWRHEYAMKHWGWDGKDRLIPPAGKRKR